MKDRLKILIVSRWYPDRVDAFNGIFVKRHAQAILLKNEVGVLYVNADPNLKNKTYDCEYGIEEGIPTTRVYYNNSLPNIPGLTSCIKLYRFLVSCKKGIQVMNKEFGVPDIVHINILSRTFFPALYYKVMHRTPYIITEQWSGYLPEDGLYRGFLKKSLTRIAVKFASVITTVSESLKNAMLSHGLKGEYIVVPNVVNTTMFSPTNKKKWDKFFLLTVADLVDRAKNISGTIRVIKKLSEVRTDFEYHHVGTGIDKVMIEQLASDTGLLNKHIFFHGTKPGAEVAAIMQRADLFILFSHYDNMPCVMIESMSCGVPFVGSAVNGIKETIKDGLGVLVASGDEAALLNTIINTIDNLHSFDPLKLHAHAVNNFSNEAIAEKFDTIYKRVVGK